MMPFDTLEKSAVSSEIEPGEFFAFLSGRTAHCSPFRVRGERITADQRMIIAPTPETLKFGHYRHFYPVRNLNAFDGNVQVKSVTADYWDSSSAPDLALYSSPIEEMADNLHMAHKVAKSAGIGADAPGADTILREAARSVSLRSEMLTNTKDAATRRQIKGDLINLVPEAPNRIYPEIIKGDLFHVLSLAWDRGLARGLVPATNAVVLLVLMRLMVDFGNAAGHRVKTVLINRLSTVIWQQLHGDGRLSETRNS
jgi:hypothetical protein